MDIARCRAIIYRARWEILVAAERAFIHILIFLLGGRHGAPLAQGAAGAIREKRRKKVKNDVVSGEVETEVLSPGKKGIGRRFVG
jgi:hypothetical protein